MCSEMSFNLTINEKNIWYKYAKHLRIHYFPFDTYGNLFSYIALFSFCGLVFFKIFTKHIFVFN